MKKRLFILILLAQGGAYANVNIESENILSKKSIVKKAPIKKKLSKVKNNRTKLYEIEGYADTNYVRFSVEILNNKVVTGRMLNQSGAGSSVHGEIVDGVLYLYSLNGQEYTVIMNK
jgi:hypothetical protein